MSSPIRDWRKREQLAQQELANLVQMPRPTLSLIENGHLAVTGRLRDYLYAVNPDLLARADKFHESADRALRRRGRKVAA